MAALQQVSIEAPGEVLSPSAGSQFLGCSAKWKYAKLDKLPDPPGGARTMGAAVHAAIGANMEQKLDTHEDLPAAGVAAVYNEAWALMVAGQYPGRGGHQPALPTEFRDDEDPAQLQAQGLALSLKYLDEACPEIQPAAVELPVSGRIGGVWVRGYVDLLDDHGRVIDLKTAARKPSEISADYKFQVATYRQLCPEGATGEARVDTLVKTKTPQLIQLSCTIDQSDVDATERLYPLVQSAIRARVFLPNRQSYLCSRRYCGFWRACQREFGGKVSES